MGKLNLRNGRSINKNDNKGPKKGFQTRFSKNGLPKTIFPKNGFQKTVFQKRISRNGIPETVFQKQFEWLTNYCQPHGK